MTAATVLVPRVSYHLLGSSARDTIRWSRPEELTIADYVRHWFPDGVWGGDSCGCVDDRCMGYHHDGTDPCGCLQAWLDQAVTERRRAAAAGPIWAAYWSAMAAGDGDAAEAAWSAGEAWVRRYFPYATSWSMDAVLDDLGRRGISIRTAWNTCDNLVWVAS